MVIWLPGGLSETYQLAHAGTAPVFYYPGVPVFLWKRLVLPATFSIILDSVGVGPRKTMEEKNGGWTTKFKKM